MAAVASTLPAGPEWTYEVKWDGNVTPKAILLDGEIVALDERGLPAFQALQHRTVKRSAIVFYAFDLLHLGPNDYRSKPLRDRRRALNAWVKVKFSQRQEFVIGGYKPAGTTFDSVLVGYYERRKFFYAGKVRAGFTPLTRAGVFKRIAPRTLDECPFVNLPNSTGKSHWGEGITAEDIPTLRWVKPEVVVEVAFTEWTAGGNLRHASFLGLRATTSPRGKSIDLAD